MERGKDVLMVRTRLIRMGNAYGVRIPEPLIERVGPRYEVELRIEGGRLIVRPVPHPRAGWDEQFERMAERGDDRLLDEKAGSAAARDEIDG
jgi:antitoxin MazE